MSKVRLAVLATLLVLLLASVALASQPTGEAERVPDTQPTDVGNQRTEVSGPPDMPAEEAAQPALPAVPAPPAMPQVGPRGPEGPSGPKGSQGPPGPAGSSDRTVVRNNYYSSYRIVRDPNSHAGHRGPYQHIKSWNPASRSYVDARDANDQRYTDQVVGQHVAELHQSGQRRKTSSAHQEARGETPPMTPPAHPYDWSWLWWLVIPALIALAIWLWWRFFRGRNLDNFAEFFVNRRFLGRRQARVRVVPGCRQDCSKQVRNVSNGERYFQPRTDAHDGDVVEYQLRTRNDAHTPLRASGVWVVEDLPDGLVFEPGTGRAFIGRRWTRTATDEWVDHSVAVPDWAIEQLLAGRALRMDQIPGMPVRLPGRNSLYIVFRAEVASATEAEDEPELDFVEPPAEEPEPGGPVITP